MEINFNEILKDLDGKDSVQPVYSDKVHELTGNPIKIGEEILTLGMIARAALLNLSPEESKLLGTEKQDRYLLAVRIKKVEKDDSPINLEIEEVTLLKRLIGEKYTPMIIGCAWNILDPK